MQLFYYVFFLFLVTFSNDLFIPIPIVNIKVKKEPAIPTGIPTSTAYEAILNVPNDADKVINILSKYLFNFLIISFLSLISLSKYSFILFISSSLYLFTSVNYIC